MDSLEPRQDAPSVGVSESTVTSSASSPHGSALSLPLNGSFSFARQWELYFFNFFFKTGEQDSSTLAFVFVAPTFASTLPFLSDSAASTSIPDILAGALSPIFGNLNGAWSSSSPSGSFFSCIVSSVILEYYFGTTFTLHTVSSTFFSFSYSHFEQSDSVVESTTTHFTFSDVHFTSF